MISYRAGKLHNHLSDLRSRPRRLRRVLRNKFIWKLSPRRELPSVLICSPGGVATTTLINHVSKFTSVNSWNDSDELKHMPGPMKGANRILYIYGNPEDVLNSLRRRGYLTAQASKLGTILGLMFRGRLQNFFIKRAIIKQRARYEAASASRKILTVEYSSLWNQLPQISEFLEIHDPAFLSSFPPKLPRTRSTAA